MEMMTQVTIVSMVSGIITRGELRQNDVLRGLYLIKRERAKKVLGYNKYICLSLFSLLSYCGFLAQQDEQHSDQVSWQWWGLISQPKIKLKSTSPRNGISDTLQQQKQHHHLREQKVHWRTVQSCQLCKHIAKTGKDVIEKFILTL